MPTKKKTKSKGGGGTPKDGQYRRFVRKYVRQKPCAKLLGANCLLMLLLISLIAIVSVFITRFAEEIAMFRNETEKVREIEKTVGRQSFQFCPYGPPTPFFTDMCSDSCGHNSIVWRRFPYRPPDESERDERCVDRLETLDCVMPMEENGVQNSNCLPLTRTGFPECTASFREGVEGLGIMDRWKEIEVIAPRVTNEEIKKAAGTNRELVVEANQLVVHCPVCSILTAYYTHVPSYKNDGKDRCYRRLGTVVEGWPDTHRFCEREQSERASDLPGVNCTAILGKNDVV